MIKERFKVQGTWHKIKSKQGVIPRLDRGIHVFKKSWNEQ